MAAHQKLDQRRDDFCAGGLRIRASIVTKETRILIASARLTALSLCSQRRIKAINYAQNRACFRSGEIQILDSNGKIERIILFSDADRRL
jgi:hypothetical protein